MMKTLTRFISMMAVIGAVSLFAQGPTGPEGSTDTPAPGVGADSEFQSDFPPRKFDPRRYDAIFRRNPFMQEVVPVEQPKEDDPWAEGLELRAVTRIGGKFVVHVENTKLTNDEDREKRKLAYHRLVEGESKEALRIETVRAHRDPSQVEVVVATGTGARSKTATLTYSQKQLSAKVPKQIAPPKPGQQTRPTTTRRTVTPRATPTPTRPTPRPTTTRRTGSSNTSQRRVILPPGLPTNR
jgi:hypothetical protein